MKSVTTVAAASAMALASLLPLPLRATDWQFDPADLGKGSDSAVALFNRGGQLPGTYRVDILLNGQHVDLRDVAFHRSVRAGSSGELVPCLSIAQLSRYGVRTEAYPELTADTGGCAVLSAIPGARATLNFGQQQLLLSIPQVALRDADTGIAPRALWNDGIPAFLMNYEADLTRTQLRQSGEGTDTAQYLQLQPGANLGPWRLRNATLWQQEGNERGRWQTEYTYLERGLNGMKSRLTLGERFTPSDVFDSVPFRGVMMASDENMVPASQRDFAPAVSGIARTQARVQVRQNGYTIYSGTVAPGPFRFDSLPVSASGGDLQVTVREADGSTQAFTVPYQTPVIALHEGYLKYNLMAGQYRSAQAGVSPAGVAQAVAMYGLPRNLTLYGGWQGATRFQAANAGLGVSLGEWGGLSLDATASRGRTVRNRAADGTAWRVRYSRLVEATHTQVSLASYQYASPGYRTLAEALGDGEGGLYADDGDDATGRKSRTTLTLSQSLGEYGSLSVSGAADTYRNGRGRSASYLAGYSVSINGVSVSLNTVQNRDGQRHNRMVSVMLSVPLARWLGGNTRATWQMTTQGRGGSAQQAGLSGEACDQQLSWNFTQSRQAGQHMQDNRALQLGWSGTYVQLTGSYSYGPAFRQSGLDAAGGLLVTRDGLTAGQPLDDTVALAEAPGAAGVPVGGLPGQQTDFRGYALTGGLQPYQENTVSLDVTRLPADVDVTRTDVTVVPTAGAVVTAAFTPHVGRRGLLTLRRPDGTPVPFGTLVTLLNQSSAGSGVADAGGQAYLPGLAAHGRLLARWGAGAGQQCRADYRLPEAAGQAGLYIATVTCR